MLDRVMRWKFFEALHRRRAMTEPVVLPARIDQLYRDHKDKSNKTASAHRPVEATIVPHNGSSCSNHSSEDGSRCARGDSGANRIVDRGPTNTTDPLPLVTTTRTNTTGDTAAHRRDVRERTCPTVPVPPLRNHCCPHLLPHTASPSHPHEHAQTHDTELTAVALTTPLVLPSRVSESTLTYSAAAAAAETETESAGDLALCSCGELARSQPVVSHDADSQIRPNSPQRGVRVDVTLPSHHNTVTEPCVGAGTTTAAIAQPDVDEDEPLHGDTVHLIIQTPTELAAMRRRRREQLRAQVNHPQAPAVVQMAEEDRTLCTRGVTLIDYVEGVVAHREKHIRALGRHVSVTEAGSMPAVGTVVYERCTTDPRGMVVPGSAVATRAVGGLLDAHRLHRVGDVDNSAAAELWQAVRLSARETVPHVSQKGTTRTTKQSRESTMAAHAQGSGVELARCLSTSQQQQQQQWSRHNNQTPKSTQQKQKRKQHQPDEDEEHGDCHRHALRHSFLSLRRHKERRCPQYHAPQPISFDELMAHPLLLGKERRQTRWSCLDHVRVPSEEMYCVPVPYTPLAESTEAAAEEEVQKSSPMIRARPLDEAAAAAAAPSPSKITEAWTAETRDEARQRLPSLKGVPVREGAEANSTPMVEPHSSCLVSPVKVAA